MTWGPRSRFEAAKAFEARRQAFERMLANANNLTEQERAELHTEFVRIQGQLRAQVSAVSASVTLHRDRPPSEAATPVVERRPRWMDRTFELVGKLVFHGERREIVEELHASFDEEWQKLRADGRNSEAIWVAFLFLGRLTCSTIYHVSYPVIDFAGRWARVLNVFRFFDG